MKPAARRGVFVVGAGRLGRTLALATSGPDFPLLGTWNRSTAAARKTRKLLGHGPCSSGQLPDRVREAKLVLVCVPDDAIAPLAGQLRDASLIGPGQVVAHCAGALSLESLSACLATGASVGSLHPLRAFVEPRRDLEVLPGTLTVLEGEGVALDLLRRFASRLNLRAATLAPDPRSRARYHAAAVSVAGNLCALMDAALELADGAGLEQEEALAGLLSLSRGVLDAIEREGGTAAALTGPVARGDEQIIEAHRKAMRGLSPELRKIYDLLIERSRQLGR